MFRLLTLRVAAVLAAAVLCAPAPAAPVPAGPSDDQLKEMALKLNDLTTLPTMNAKLKELTKDAPTAKRLVKLASKLQADGGKKPPLNFNAAIVLANLAANPQVKEYAAAESLFEWSMDAATKLQSGDKIEMSYSGLSGVLMAQKKYAAAEEAAQKLIDSDDPKIAAAKLVAFEQLVVAKVKSGDADGAVERVEQLMARDPNGWSFHQLKVRVQREAGRFDDAAATYLDLIKKVKADDKLEDDAKEQITRRARYFLTSVYVDGKKIDKAVEVLRELVKEEPDTATYKNDLGFILADNDREIPEAEKLIRDALKLDEAERKKALETAGDDATDELKDALGKPNAAYVDSLGWVLYKKKEYAEALKLLEQAAADRTTTESIEIWDHVADAQIALGKTAEAVATWEKALKLDDESPRDAGRRKAVTAKLKKAKAEK